MRFKEENIYRVFYKGGDDNYIADSMEKAIKMCRYDNDDAPVYKAELLGSARRQTTI